MPNSKHTPGLVIRFDGPPGPEAGRFVEVEIDGRSVSVGEWVEQGNYWLLVLGPVYAAAPKLLEALRAVKKRWPCVDPYSQSAEVLAVVDQALAACEPKPKEKEVGRGE